MSALSDEQLIEIYALNCDCEGTRVMLNGLRAVAEAAVKAVREAAPQQEGQDTDPAQQWRDEGFNSWRSTRAK